jgi:hypothetical protein
MTADNVQNFHHCISVMDQIRGIQADENEDCDLQGYDTV